MKTDREKAEEFFQTYIFGFVYNDIENCIKARANYVVALSLVSYTEFVGGLISGELGLDNTSGPNFKKLMEFFPKAYQNLNLKVEFTENGRVIKKEGIYEIFRCGLAHEYFVKNKFSSVWNNPDGKTARHIGIKKRYGKLYFYDNEYFRDFKKAVEKFYKRLISNKNRELDKFLIALNRLESRKLV